MELRETIRHMAEIINPGKMWLVIFMANSFNFSHPAIHNNNIP
jgi:hypothetical protein